MGCGDSKSATTTDTSKPSQAPTSSPASEPAQASQEPSQASQPTELKNVKLTYFNLKGRAETIRVLLHYGGIQFEDERIGFEQWPELKPTTPFGTLPMLTVDGHKMNQTNSIARLVACKTGMYGSGHFEESKIDAIVDACGDLFEPIPAAYIAEKDEDKKKELIAKYWNETAPHFLDRLEKELESNDGGDGFFVGTSISWADIRFWDQYCAMLERCEEVEEVKSQYPKLTALYDKLQEDPKIKSWVEKRPDN